MADPPNHVLLRSLGLHAHRYELGAVLKVLFRCGFDWHSIRFEGIRELDGPRSAFVRQVRVETRSKRLAIISVDTGLLSPSSPLPEYFRAFARRLPDPDPMINFLGFWDSLLLADLAFAMLPRLSVGRDGRLGKSYRARLRIGSAMGLHWLFRSLFPELRLEITPAVFQGVGQGHRARVGATLDGRIVLGAEFKERRSGFRVRLHADEAAFEGVSDWETEAVRRLAPVAPLLDRMGRGLEVVLRFERYKHGQRLVAHDSGRPQLGVRPWLLPEPRVELGPGEVIVRRAS
jgi:hypothetical protein